LTIASRRAPDLLDHIRPLARERDQSLDVIESAVTSIVRVHAQ
jgi:hypothetical protein